MARMDIRGHEEALSALGDAIRKTDRKKELFDQVGAALVVSTQRRFETETGPDGRKWPDSLRKLVLGGRTLTWTARLVSSMTHEATDEQVAVGTAVEYAWPHQTGATIRAKTPAGLRWRAPGNGGWTRKQEVTIPARPFLGLDKEDETKIGAIAAEWLAGSIGGGADAQP